MNFQIHGRKDMETAFIRLDEDADLARADRKPIEGVTLYFLDGRLVALGFPKAKRQLPQAVWEALSGCGRQGQLRAVPYGTNTPPQYDDPPGLTG